MKLRTFLAAAAIAALPLAASAATFVVPAAGTGPGDAGSQWQSELTLHSAAPRIITVNIALHQGRTVHGPIAITLQPRETRSIEDIVKNEFGIAAGTGALVITTSDRDARGLAITSRTFNLAPNGGEYGQDIPAVPVANAAVAGDLATLTGPSSVATERFNFGLYVVEDAAVEWQLVRANGTVVKSIATSYEAGQHMQYNSGVRAIFAETPQDNDTIYARVISGKVIAYGSVINQTGDPSFIPSIRTRIDVAINFEGVDLDENGTIDLVDANNDGVLDAPIEMATSLYPSYFQVVARGEFDEVVTFEVVSSPATAVFLDQEGTMRVTPFNDVKGTTGSIVVRATTGTSEGLLTIPVIFR